MTKETQKATIKPSKWPLIRQRGSSWQVDCGYALSEKRLRKTLKTRPEAEQFAADCRRELQEKNALDRHERKNRAVSLANLTDTQRAEVLEAYRLLERPRGLLEAVEFYVAHNRARAGSMTLAELRDQWLEAKEKTGRRGRTLRNYRTLTKEFNEENGSRLAHSITGADVKAYFDKGKFRGETLNTHRRVLLALFNYGLKIGAVETSPMTTVEPAAVDHGEIDFYTPEQAAALLHTAAKVHPVMIPYLAIGLFAGLRPERELGGLSWDNINLERGNIYVLKTHAKKRRSRFVDIQPNLAKWLELAPNKTGKVFFSRRMKDTICEAAGVAWIKDGMRHSFGSHHLAKFKNRALTERQMGLMGESNVLFDHYAATVMKHEGEAYFAIEPATAAA